MKKFYTTIFLIVFSFLALQAQNRWLDAQFGVQREANVAYGVNVGVITGAPVPETLLVDIYKPVGDNMTNRPLVLIAHTGSFLPPLYNGQITGSRSDSTVTATAAYLTSRGFVVAAYTYRLGWLPTSPDQNVRTGSLLQAAYRAIQDTRSCIRFFKRSVAEAGNPYGIDPAKICVWGIGTGGYLAMGAGSLNDFSEVVLEKFINTATLKPYIDSTIYGNIYGNTQAAICIPNHPGYSSDFQLSVNLGGALGDSTWLDGEPVEPAYVGVHCTNDFFAPYYEGAVIVPTTNQFVIYAMGTRKAIEKANQLGSNNVLNSVNPQLDKLSALINFQKSANVVLPLTQQRIQLGTDNFYGFDIPLIFNGVPVPQGSPWDWWDLPTLRVVVAAVNASRGTNFNADSLHLSGLRTNPDMSPSKGRTYLDTVYALALPRMCVALSLGCQNVAVKDVEASEIGLKVYPNPMRENLQLETHPDHPIESVYFYNLDGQLVKAHSSLKSSSVVIPRHQLRSGFYLTEIRTKDKKVTTQIIVQD